MTTITVATGAPIVALDITAEVAAAVSGEGVLAVSVPHTTCAVFVNEDDPELLDDLARVARDLLAGFEPFAHANAGAHIMASLLGSTVLVPVSAGALDLGAYQRLLLVELDGPKQRTVHLRLLASAAG